MTKVFTIKLDSVRKDRNRQEYRYISRATCNGHVITGDGFIVSRMVKHLRQTEGSIDAIVQVFRGGTLVFAPMPLKTAFMPTGDQPEHLRRGKA